jgi:hypothetical protein
MEKSRAEDKSKRGRWERRNFQWESKFEYFDQTGSGVWTGAAG